MVLTALKKNKEFYEKLVLFIFLLGIFLRFTMIAVPQDMWHDASFTYLFSQKDINFIQDSNDVHPPLYYLFMKVVLLVGHNEFWIRAVGILFFVGMFYYANKYLKENHSWETRVVVLSLISFSPTMIYYSIEPRNYAMGMFFVMAQIYYFFKSVKEDNTKHELFFIFLSILMLFTHYYTAFLLFVEVIYILVQKNKKTLLRFTLMGLSIFVCCIPLYIYFLKMIPKLHSFWFDKIDFLSFFSSIIYQFMPSDSAKPQSIFILILILSCCLTVFIIWNRKKWFFPMLFFIPLSLVWLISQFHPMYHHRFFLFYAIGLYMLIGQSISFLVNSKKGFVMLLGYAFIILIPILMLFAIEPMTNSFPTELRESSLVLKEELQQDKIYVFIHTSPFSQTPMKYYFRDYKVINYLKTNLTKQQRFTAGGSVIEDWEIINSSSEINCYDGCYYFEEDANPMMVVYGYVVYREGGLLVYTKLKK